MKSFVFLKQAEDEFLEATGRYEQERVGLGDDFQSEVHAVITRLMDYPESGAVVFRDARLARVKRFPYDLVYRIQHDLLIVVSAKHQHRKPGLWKSRL
jgi:ParE toxin of type II toxin-antitoxin system, parDE